MKSIHRPTPTQAAARAALGCSLVVCALAGLIFAPTHLRAGTIDDLLDKLKAKGILSEPEYREFKQAREAEKAAGAAQEKAAPAKAAKAQETSNSEMKGNFADGVRWESLDKRHAIGVNGRFQFDYRDFGGNDALAANTFDVRTARIGVAGKFWDFYSFDVTADFGALAANSHLDVAWVNVAWWKPVQFRFGQFKMPMSIDQLTSSRFIDFHERSIMNDFIPAKERGVMVHGEPKKGIFYGVAVSTGQGKNNNETNNIVDSNDFIGRVGVNIAELIGQKGAVYHLAAAYSTGKLPASTTVSARTEARGTTFFTTQPFAGTDTERKRQLLEASLAYGPVKFQSEYLKTDFSGSGYDRDIKAWYASLGWLITGERYANAYSNGAYGRIRPKNNFLPGNGGWGAWEVGLRYTDFDASAFPILAAGSANPGTGAVIPTLTSGAVTFQPTNKASAWTLGLKWITTPNTRFSLNYIKTKYDTDVIPQNAPGSPDTDDETAITLRAWFDF